MESLYLLVPLSIVLVFVIGALFWWSLRHGQFDDLEGPAYRLLMDDKDEFPVDAGQQSGENSAPPRNGASPEGGGGGKTEGRKVV